MEKAKTVFKDLRGREWDLAMNVELYMRLHHKFGIDIGKVFDQDDNWLTEIVVRDDMIRFMEIITECCSTQREQLDIELKDFLESLTGDVMGEAAEAFLGAIVLFLPAHKRTALTSILSSIQTGMEKTAQRIEEHAQEMTIFVEERLDEELDKKLGETLSELKNKKT